MVIYTFPFSSSCNGPYVCYSTGNTPPDYTNPPSTPSLVQDDSEDSSDSEDEIDVAGRKLAKKYKDNPSGLDAYCEQKKREISQRYSRS